jgi:hypothetical protein
VDSLKGIYAQLRDKRIPGGCPDCGAYQTMRQERPNVYTLTIHHDDTCPTYRAMTKEKHA